jgi:ABC-type nitrate/sulfonate/bicarbonate transport system substrate-binding protein
MPNPLAPHAGPRRLLALLLVVVLAGCAGTDSTPSPPGPASPSPDAASPAAPSPVSPTPGVATRPVRLALDWTPNTNHLGFFVAQAQGWYREVGVELDVLPYTGTSPEAILTAKQADCGISFHDAMTFAVAAGAPITSAMAILQHTAQEIAVLEASDIERPRDLDGRTYAGFGYPNEEPTVEAVIREDGGSGEFTSVVLDTAAYEALYAGRADFVISFTAWDGIEAGQRGIDLRTFAFTDYGFPDFYQVVLACEDGWLEREPELARAFIGATARGFSFAHEQPDEAAAMLMAENPGAFDANPELPEASARYLAEGGFFVDDRGQVGTQTLEQWRGYSAFLYEEGLLADADGRPLTAPPDYEALFTNDFLP